MKKHFVTFQSPGIFFNESTTKDIESWDVGKALEMAASITECHGAVPYAFYFTTRTRGENDLDSKVTKSSGRYFLGGKSMTLKEVEKTHPDKDILISNMKCNGWKNLFVKKEGWMVMQPIQDGDVVL